MCVTGAGDTGVGSCAGEDCPVWGSDTCGGDAPEPSGVGSRGGFSALFRLFGVGHPSDGGWGLATAILRGGVLFGVVAVRLRAFVGVVGI